ncbi:hypothetical protein [Novosphingobium mangrovi (ex Huang et al. 2023)]|uniref:Uncharacterized protein n=1 Tax=Novosphingobium mangrovi (ex Huang et al. 2023) TaxID=2976432 RepID=A0ABT2I2A0_9SPHN|nr:hypothetical protein [Novosphingobium mangrovi (ex Huang et al. 2023)]MCT2398926.1 hypothetical protein [Novosphingobium mangrovi (ex Huang et al. 2023)]
MEPVPPVAGSDSRWPVWWWGIPAALAALVPGFLLLRRRRNPAGDEEVQSVTPSIPPRPVAPAPAAPSHRAGCDLEFEPAAMRLSLVYATLQFHLRLTAQTELPPGKLLADMISAHGSLPQAMQLAPPPEALGTVQTFARMTPGQVLEVKGELQLPLSVIRPVQRGGAAFMVPLVRLALLGDARPDLPHLELGCVFTVGIPGSGPALSSLRLDTGPREFTELSAREIEAARRTVLLPLDHARAAG